MVAQRGLPHRGGTVGRHSAGQPSRASVYRALIDAEAVAHTDTYHGRFVALVPDELVVEVDEFETAGQATAAT